jgi:hypothetical protein
MARRRGKEAEAEVIRTKVIEPTGAEMARTGRKLDALGIALVEAGSRLHQVEVFAVLGIAGEDFRHGKGGAAFRRNADGAGDAPLGKPAEDQADGQVGGGGDFEDDEAGGDIDEIDPGSWREGLGGGGRRRWFAPEKNPIDPRLAGFGVGRRGVWIGGGSGGCAGCGLDYRGLLEGPESATDGASATEEGAKEKQEADFPHGGRDYSGSRRIESLRGPWAPRTRMRSMSPVRLGPVMKEM